MFALRGFNLRRNGAQQKFTSLRASRPSRALVVAATATATLKRPPVEPPLPELPSMAKKIKVGINGGSLPFILSTDLCSPELQALGKAINSVCLQVSAESAALF